MRAVQLALLVICIQIGMGLVHATGLFTGTYYESELTSIRLPQNVSALSETEQSQASIDIMNSIYNALLWGWIRAYFEPLYSLDVGVRGFVDKLILFLNGISGFVIGIAFIEFVRNRLNVLGG